MPAFVFTTYAARLFAALPLKEQERIREKLRELKHHPDFSALLKPLRGIAHVTHRLRIGPYRLLLRKLEDDRFEVVKVGHRRDVYR